jgi:hypothetical protein
LWGVTHGSLRARHIPVKCPLRGMTAPLVCWLPSRGGVTAIDLGHVKTRFDSDYEASSQIMAGLADLRGSVSSDGTVAITSVGWSFSREPRSCTMKCDRERF